MAAEPQTYEPEKLTAGMTIYTTTIKSVLFLGILSFIVKNKVIFILKQNKKPTECKVALMPHFDCQNGKPWVFM